MVMFNSSFNDPKTKIDPLLIWCIPNHIIYVYKTQDAFFDYYLEILFTTTVVPCQKRTFVCSRSMFFLTTPTKYCAHFGGIVK